MSYRHISLGPTRKHSTRFTAFRSTQPDPAPPPVTIDLGVARTLSTALHYAWHGTRGISPEVHRAWAQLDKAIESAEKEGASS